MKDHRVNKLAEVRSKIAHLKEVEGELIRALKESGPGTYNGEDHYVVISDVERKTLNIKAARQKLSRQFIQAHTKVTNCLSLQLFGYSKKEAA
jgi:putative heme iron utilization protein